MEQELKKIETSLHSITFSLIVIAAASFVIATAIGLGVAIYLIETL